MIMETRWAIENTGFHELASAWKLDRPYVHSGRSVAVTALLVLAFVAYNAMQSFYYRELGISPERPERTFGAICRCLLASIESIKGKGSASNRGPRFWSGIPVPGP